jgi:class 3 adenylate cyclase
VRGAPVSSWLAATGRLVRYKGAMSERSVRDRNRFDFQTVEVVDPETGRVAILVRPDPGRYEWRERGGQHVLFDRFDHFYFSEELVRDMLEQALAMEPGPELAVIPDIAAYVAKRRPAIAAALEGEVADGELVDLAETQLRAFAKDELEFAILSVDVVGSTRLQTRTDTQTFARTINSLLGEVSQLVALFHGHVLKYTGDGLIAYFAPPTFIIKNDAAVDCAYCVRRLVYDGMKPELEAAGLPTIDVRLGIDSGQAAIVVLGSVMTKRHADLIGDVVSLALKIQGKAGAGEIFLGETVERNLHFPWRELCDRVHLPESEWDYSIAGGAPYPVFRLDTGEIRPVERSRALEGG